VNAGKTKVMWCRVCMDQTEDSGEHPCGRELDATQSYVWSVIDGFTRGVVVFQDS